MKIQHTVKRDDKVCVYMKNFDLPVFRYEYYYSNILWIKSLKEEDISTDPYFRAGDGNNYDYQWCIFSHAKLSGREARPKLKELKLRLSKEPDLIVDLGCSLPPKIFGIRASKLNQPNKN